MNISGLIMPNAGRERTDSRPPQLLLPGRQAPPVIDLTGDSPLHNRTLPPPRAEVIDVDSLPDLPPRPRSRTHYEGRTLPPLPRLPPIHHPHHLHHPYQPMRVGFGPTVWTDRENLDQILRTRVAFAQNLQRQAVRRFEPPQNLDYDRPSDFAKEPRPFDEQYTAPPPAHQGFTRSPKTDDILVCSDPGCDAELGEESEDESKQRVWVSKCGHMYCGSCAKKYQILARKRRINGVSQARCAIKHCGESFSRNSLIELRF